MEIKIFGCNACIHCEALKNWLKSKNVPFSYLDVCEDENAAEEIVKKTGKIAIPVTEINGKVIIGFNKEAIEKEL